MKQVPAARQCRYLFNSNRYTHCTLEPSCPLPLGYIQEVDRANHSWGNYILCAYKGVHEHLKRTGRPAPPLEGLQLLVEGRVPQGAPRGLASRYMRFGGRPCVQPATWGVPRACLGTCLKP